MTERRLPPSLLALTPGTLQRARSGATEAALIALERAATAAISSGVRAFLVREPALEDGPLLELAMRLRARLDEAADSHPQSRGWLGIHDRAHLAEAAGADAVHLGGKSLPVTPARTVVGDLVALGVSSHRGDSPESSAGADFLLHAPVFEPNSKSGHGRETLGWCGVLEFARLSGPPVHALGGITAEHLARAQPGTLSSLGGVALIGGLWGTGPEPIDGMGRALTDTGGIARRAAALVAACAAHFGGASTAPGDGDV